MRIGAVVSLVFNSMNDRSQSSDQMNEIPFLVSRVRGDAPSISFSRTSCNNQLVPGSCESRTPSLIVSKPRPPRPSRDQLRCPQLRDKGKRTCFKNYLLELKRNLVGVTLPETTCPKKLTLGIQTSHLENLV